MIVVMMTMVVHCNGDGSDEVGMSYYGYYATYTMAGMMVIMMMMIQCSGDVHVHAVMMMSYYGYYATCTYTMAGMMVMIMMMVVMMDQHLHGHPTSHIKV